MKLLLTFLAIITLPGCMGGKTMATYKETIMLDNEPVVVKEITFHSGKEYRALSAHFTKDGATVNAVGVDAFEGQRIEAEMWKSFWQSAIEGAKIGGSGGMP